MKLKSKKLSIINKLESTYFIFKFGYGSYEIISMLDYTTYHILKLIENYYNQTII